MAMDSNSKVIKKLKYIGFILSFLIVQLVVTGIFYFYINISSILMAFEVPKGESIFYNFAYVIESFSQSSSKLGESLINTMYFFLANLVILFPCGFMFSYFIYKKIKFYKFFRVIFYFPSILASTVLVSVFKKMVAVDGPILTLIDSIFGLEMVPELLGNSDYAIWTIIGYIIWTGFGSNILLLGGAMARIPSDVLDSAKIDGASPGREMISIIVPMIWPTITMMLIIMFSSLFTASGPILLFTEGEFGTFTISYYIFDMVYKSGPGQYPFASAVGLFFTAIGIPIILGLRFLLEKLSSDVEY